MNALDQLQQSPLYPESAELLKIINAHEHQGQDPRGVAISTLWDCEIPRFRELIERLLWKEMITNTDRILPDDYGYLSVTKKGRQAVTAFFRD